MRMKEEMPKKQPRKKPQNIVIKAVKVQYCIGTDMVGQKLFVIHYLN